MEMTLEMTQEMTQEDIREFITYNPESGVCTWNERSVDYFRTQKACNGWNTRFCGMVAGSLKKDRSGSCYRIGLTINKKAKRFLLHRMIWLYVYGELPEFVSHRDLDGTNNKLSNLYDASKEEITKHARLSRDNKSGVSGVSYDKNERYVKRWRVTVGKTFRKRFMTFDEACECRSKVLLEMGYHEKHGLVQ